jgi:23S rRNA pseudouridine1911/1915/1917 synthase
MEWEVLYEDNHLLIVNKPAGWLTQPSPDNPDSLETACKQWLKDKYQKPGNVFLEAVHRLDKPVSGIVIFAKTSKALSRLNALTRNQQIRKIYHAWVDNKPLAKEGILEHYLKHGDHKAEVVSPSHPEAKLCRLKYRILDQKDALYLIEIELETGRYHQIRAQLAAAGCPISGDVKYGSKQLREHIALHHVRIEFLHPVTQQSLSIISY